MSYNITVAVAGGELTVTHGGTVPDGKHMISGHEDTTMINLGVVRTGTDGKQIVQANASRPQEV